MLESKPFKVSLADKQSVILPEVQIADFIASKQKRIKVKAKFEEKQIEFYAALRKEKSGLVRIYFSKAKQHELGVYINDTFVMQIFEDTSKYGVDMCEELEAVLLSDLEAYTIFETLTPGQQRTIIYAISRYKSIQTRVDKSLLFTENLRRGIKDAKLWLKSNE